MRYLRVALASLLVMASMGGSASAGTTPHRPPGWDGRPSAYEQLLAARGSRLSPAEAAKLMRELLRDGSGEGAVVADPEFVYPHRIGDLDGDGLADLVTVEFNGQSATLNARRGTDGSVLWTVPDSHAVLRTSRGLLTLRNSDAPAPLPGVTTRSQVVELRRDDGSVVWAYTVPMTGVRFGDMYQGGAADLDFVGGLREIDDATGDGAPDVWIATSTFVQLNTGETMITGDTVTGRTIDGLTGLEVGRVTASAVDALPWVVPVSDVSGDGLSDSIVFTANSDDTGTLEARSAQGLTHWSSTVPARFAYVITDDVTGDGATDVMLQAFIDDSVRRLTYDGTDGSLLWNGAEAGYTDVAGDIDGDGGTDLIRMDTLGSSVIATALSGATGETLWGPVSYDGPPDAWVLFCTCTGDVNADGLWDPMTAEVVFGLDVTVNIRILDGASGGALWSGLSPPNASFPMLLGADADGDGAGDIGVVATDGTTMTVSVSRGVDGTPLWSSSAPWDGFAIYLYGDDVRAGGGTEVLLSSGRFVDEWFAGSAQAYDSAGRFWLVP